MIPYLLAVAGGYLIGNSMNKTSQFDKGGKMNEGESSNFGKPYRLTIMMKNGEEIKLPFENINDAKDAKIRIGMVQLDRYGNEINKYELPSHPNIKNDDIEWKMLEDFVDGRWKTHTYDEERRKYEKFVSENKL